MDRKIEMMLRVMGDLQRFKNGAQGSGALESDELFEQDLEFIAAASSMEIDWDEYKNKENNPFRKG